jgi:hypothetical protein
MTTASISKGGTPRRTGAPTQGKAGWAVAIVFAFLNAYSVWQAVAALIQTVIQDGFNLQPVSWFVLVASILVPIVAYGLALWVGWRLPVWAKAVVFLVALTVSTALGFDLNAILLAAILH